MRKSVFIIILLLTSEAFSAPQLNGTPKELASYLNGVKKTVTISASADRVVVSDRAIVRLMVKNENTSLARALKENTDIRDVIKTQTQRAGVEPGNIRDSKFSTTPQFGIFGEKPKSYTVENIVTIEITSERQLIKVASIIDRDENVFHISTITEVGDEEGEFNLLLEQALKNIKEKAGIYQRQLKVKLTPVSFDDSVVNTVEIVRRNTDKKSKNPGSGAGTGDSGLGSKKLTTTVAVTYKVAPGQSKR